MEHLDGGTLLGISAIVFVLGGFYYLLIKLPSDPAKTGLTEDQKTEEKDSL